jgi:hypothetical protein
MIGFSIPKTSAVASLYNLDTTLDINKVWVARLNGPKILHQTVLCCVAHE